MCADAHGCRESNGKEVDTPHRAVTDAEACQQSLCRGEDGVDPNVRYATTAAMRACRGELPCYPARRPPRQGHRERASSINASHEAQRLHTVASEPISGKTLSKDIRDIYAPLSGMRMWLYLI